MVAKSKLHPRDSARKWTLVDLLLGDGRYVLQIKGDSMMEAGILEGDYITCIITSSYEARAYGIKTGMRLKEALQLCPDLIRCPTRPRRYAAIAELLDQLLGPRVNNRPNIRLQPIFNA